jgi:ABC-2 type transport system ATP-binding protein
MTDSIAIRTDNLNKQFGWRWRPKKRVHAVKNLSLEIAAGQVFGFLGPNGAGKTTTIRMLLDLIRPNQGDVYLFGKHVRRERSVLSRVGSLVEGAAFYNFLSGRRNLEVLALSSNLDLPPASFDRVLEIVDMKERARRKVKGYSTGMKQRLGIAAALLGDPDLVILDEPTNGLDPHGIHEVRTLIRELANIHGKTVFLSSHQLSEVEQVCDRVAIINKGEMIREGKVSDLVQEQARMCLVVKPVEKAAQVLEERWTVTPHENGSLLVDVAYDDVPQIVQKLVGQEIAVYEVTTQRQSLEEFFLSVTGGEDEHVG